MSKFNIMYIYLICFFITSCMSGESSQEAGQQNLSQKNSNQENFDENLEGNEILGEDLEFEEQNNYAQTINNDGSDYNDEKEKTLPSTFRDGRSQEKQSFEDENYEDQNNKIIAQRTLWWVGFDSREPDGHVRVEVVIKGDVKYDIFQEINLAEQPEVVLRLYQTKSRKKLLRDINASEFRSPVAWIRVRESMGFTDVVMTLRDEVKPKLFTENGKFLFLFSIPDRYYGNKSIGVASSEKAPLLHDADVFPVILGGSESPKAIPRNFYAENQNFEKIQEEDFNDVELDEPPELPNDFNNEVSYDEQESSSNEEQYNNETQQQYDNKDQDNYNNQQEDYDDNTNDEAHVIWSSSAWTVAQDNLFDDNNVYDNDAYEEDNNIGPESPNEVLNSNGGNNVSINDENVQVGNIQDDLEGQDEETIKVAPVVAMKKIVDLNFRNSNLQDVIRTLSEESEMNFLFAQDVQNITVNIRLKNVTFEDALDSILRTYSLASTKLAPNVYRIVRIQNLAEEKRTLVESQRDHIALIPTKILVARLSYTKAPDIVEMVQQILTGTGDTRVRVQSDKRTNSLIVEAIPSELSKVKALIERLDLKIPQVRISSRVIEVLNDKSKSMGINWTSPLAHDGLPGLAGGNLPIPKRLASTFAIDAGQTTTGNGRINLLLGNINSAMEMRLGLSLSENKGYTKQIQNSSVVVMDSETAKISAVKTDYIQLAEALEEITYTVELEVTPQITAEGSVLLDVKITAADPSASNADGEQNSRNERALETHLLKRSGETAVIGGLYTSSSIQGYAGVPFFSNIPIIGSLFRSNQETEDRRDLVVMITPEIVGGENNEEFSVVESGNNLNSPMSEEDDFENPANFGDGFDDATDVEVAPLDENNQQQAQQEEQDQNQQQNQQYQEQNQQYQQQNQQQIQQS
ncbi:MAG: secretin N-terminal domain-containing protein [Oligoflexales bacterium]